MLSWRKKLNRISMIRALSSVKITVACLVLLFILTLWGTIDQVANGLYLAQARFFNSWAFTFWGFVPFPGAQLVLWVMFVNLACVALTRFIYGPRKAGIIIIHLGLLLFFVAAFVTFHGIEESNLTLGEGEGSDVSTAYHVWELSVWTQDGNRKLVEAFDAGRFVPGQKLIFPKYGLAVEVKAYYPNGEAYGGPAMFRGSAVLNGSGIGTLKPVPLDKEPQKNQPGAVLGVRGSDAGDVNVLLYGGEPKPFMLTKDGKPLYMMLRLKRFPLPVVLRLRDFMMERHPNTDIARSYQSLVEILSQGASREALISMNEPLRYKDFTFYQSSYAIDAGGHEYSTLAVVKNTGRLLPYVATFVTFAGLAVHFLMMAFESKLKKRKPKSA